MRSVLAAAAAVEVGPGDGPALVERFDQAWRSGTPPRIEEFLARLRPDDTETPRSRLLQEFIKIDLEYRWQQVEEPSTPRDIGGPPPSDAALPERPRLEDYVACFPELGPAAQLPLELIGEEYWVRQRWGDRPALSEYAVRFAAHGPRLEEFLAQLDQQLAAEGPPQPRPPAPPGPATPLVCPHCHHPLPVEAAPASADCICPACGGGFRVEGRTAGLCPTMAAPFARVGRYELKAQLGVGAFGSVWRAWDTELAREVAVKLPRSGQFTDPHEEERFLREARATAQLQHPQIVAVHDVGRDQHTIYLVADLVHGVSLAQWLRQGRLSVHQAADLVAGVADALDYAHRHGVVHRDLKPSNIMLDSEAAGDMAVPAYGLARVMDFGLAKREAGEITLTLEGQVLGTPAYMSPEQIRDPHAVDGRSDIYSLGVILYELLTGDLPFRGVLRMVLEQVQQDEPRPPRRLNDKIPRDLETITLKCLDKEPGRRYPTARELKEDLKRWQRGEAIRARPLGVAGRCWRWCRRKPAVASLAAALVLVGGTGFGTVAWQWRRAESHLLEMKQAQEETLAYFDLASQTVQEVDALLTDVNNQREAWKDMPVMDQKQRELLRRALAIYQKFPRQQSSNPRLRQETGRSYLRVGTIQRVLGQYPEAEEALRSAVELFAKLADEFPNQSDYRYDLASSYRGLAILLSRAARRSEAEEACRQALDIQRRLADDFPGQTDYRQDLANDYSNLGVLLEFTNRLRGAEDAYRQALTIQQPLANDFPNRPGYRADLADSYRNLGALLQTLNQPQEAEEAYRQALKIQQALVTDFSDRPNHRHGLAMTYHNLGLLLKSINQFREAEEAYGQAVQVRQSLAAAFPNRPDYRCNLADSYTQLGDLLQNVNRFREAEQAYRQALTIQQPLADSFPNRPDYRQVLARGYHNLGNLLKLANRVEDAEEAYRQAVTIQQRLAAAFPAQPEYREGLAVSYRSLGDLLQESNRPVEAETVYREALRIQQRFADDFPKQADYRQRLADTYRSLGDLLQQIDRFGEAEEAYRQAVKLQQPLADDFPAQPEYRSRLALSYCNLGAVLQAMDRLREAEEICRRAVTIRQALVAEFAGQPDYREELASSFYNLGILLRRMKRLPEAEDAYRQGLKILQPLADEFPNRPLYQQDLADSYYNLGVLLSTVNRFREAEDAYRQAAKVFQPLADKYRSEASYRQGLADSYYNLAFLLKRREVFQEAEDAFRQALTIYQQLTTESPKDPAHRHDLADSYKGLGSLLKRVKNLPEAAEAYRQAVTTHQALAAEFPSRAKYQSELGSVLDDLASVLKEQGKLAEARALQEKSIGHHRAALKADPQHLTYRGCVRDHYLILADTLLRLQKPVEAAQAVTELARVFPDRAGNAYEAACLLARCVPRVEHDNSLPMAKRQELARAYGEQARALFRAALWKGFRTLLANSAPAKSDAK